MLLKQTRKRKSAGLFTRVLGLEPQLAWTVTRMTINLTSGELKDLCVPWMLTGAHVLTS